MNFCNFYAKTLNLFLNFCIFRGIFVFFFAYFPFFSHHLPINFRIIFFAKYSHFFAKFSRNDFSFSLETLTVAHGQTKIYPVTGFFVKNVLKYLWIHRLSLGATHPDSRILRGFIILDVTISSRNITMTREKADLSLRIPIQMYDTFA